LKVLSNRIKIQDTGYRTNTRCRIQDAGYRIQDTGVNAEPVVCSSLSLRRGRGEVTHTGYKIQDSGWGEMNCSDHKPEKCRTGFKSL
jgi:hypothetical protein